MIVRGCADTMYAGCQVNGARTIVANQEQSGQCCPVCHLPFDPSALILACNFWKVECCQSIRVITNGTHSVVLATLGSQVPSVIWQSHDAIAAFIGDHMLKVDQPLITHFALYAHMPSCVAISVYER